MASNEANEPGTMPAAKAKAIVYFTLALICLVTWYWLTPLGVVNLANGFLIPVPGLVLGGVLNVWKHSRA